MNNAQPSDILLAALLDALATYVQTTVSYPKIGLFTGAPSLNNNTTLATLAALEVTFTGYSRLNAAVNSARRNANGDYILPLQSVVFQPSAPGGTLPQIATGYFVVGKVGATESVLYSEFLDTPFIFVDEFSGMTLSVDLYIKNLRVYGGGCSVC